MNKKQINWEKYRENLVGSLSNEKIWSLGCMDKYNPHISNIRDIEAEIESIDSEDFDNIIDMHSETPDFFDDFLIVDESYIEIAFIYNKELYVERVYTKDIDRGHYDDMWDWWFNAGSDDVNSELIFEITGDKNEEGQFTTDNLYVNVYDDEDADNPIATIKEISYRKSWVDRKAFM